MNRRSFAQWIGTGAVAGMVSGLASACSNGGSTSPPTVIASTDTTSTLSVASPTVPSTSTPSASPTEKPTAGVTPNIPATTSATGPAQELRFSIGDVGTIDPNVVVGGDTVIIAYALFDPLVTFDANGNPTPVLAERWDVSDDGTRYTFHLRQGVRWSDGKSLTAHDFEYSWKRALSPALASNYASSLFIITGGVEFNQGKTTDASSVQVTATDDLTLSVRTTSAAPYFLHLCSTWTYLPVPKWAVDKSGANWVLPENIVTCGMFTFQSMVYEHELVIARNTGYWGAQSTLNKVTFPVSNDPYATSVRDYKANTLDITNKIGPSDAIQLQGDATYRKQFQHSPGSITIFVVFDCGNTDSPVSNQEIRQALYLATDQTALCQTVSQGLYAPAPTLTPPGIAGYNPDAALSGGVAAAKQKLTSAGFPNGTGFPVLELVWFENAELDLVAPALQQMWQTNLGIRVHPRRITHALYRMAPEQWSTDKFVMYLSSWVSDYLDPSSWYPRLWTSNSDFYDTHWRNSAFDAQVAKADRALDPAVRKAEYEQAEVMLMQGMPMLPLYHSSVVALVKPYVQGYAGPASSAQQWGLFGRIQILDH